MDRYVFTFTINHRTVSDEGFLLNLLVLNRALPDHFHVHIVHVGCVGTMGSTVGQAHLLDDIISLVCTSISMKTDCFAETRCR